MRQALRSAVVLFVVCLGAAAARGAAVPADTVPPPSPYRLEIHVAGGIQWAQFRDQRTPLSPNDVQRGGAGIARVMWHPDHLLSAGVMTGFVTLARETITPQSGVPLDLALSAIPVQLSFAMQKFGVEIGVGIGGYQLISSAGSQGNRSIASSQFEIGVSAYAGVSLSITDRFAIGPEVMLHTLSYRGITAYAAHLHLRYDLFTY